MAIGKLIIFDRGIEERVEIMSRIGGIYKSYDDRQFTLKDGIFLPSLLKQNAEGNKQKLFLTEIALSNRCKINSIVIPEDVKNYISMYLIQQQMLIELDNPDHIIVHPVEFIILFARCCFKLGFGKTSYDAFGVHQGFFDKIPDVMRWVFGDSDIIKLWLAQQFIPDFELYDINNNLHQFDFDVTFEENYTDFNKSFFRELMVLLVERTQLDVSLFNEVFSKKYFHSDELAHQLVIAGFSETKISSMELRNILDACGITESIIDMFPRYLNTIAKFCNN